MSHTLDYVINKLKCGDVRFDIDQNTEDSAAVVLPDYSRILGVWPDVNEPCPLWINDKFLEDPNDKSVHWPNPGGHRIWIAPEKEFFIADLHNPWDTYKVPAQMDPGHCEYRHKDGIYRFTNHMDLYAHSSKVNVPLSYERTNRFLTPQQTSQAMNLDRSKSTCIAYEEDVLLRTESDFRAGVWSLLQVPLDGRICLPLCGKADYEELFGEFHGQIETKDDLLQIELNPIQHDFKIGLIASSIKDRIAHIRNHNGKTTLIVQLFEKGNDSDYIDTPWKKDAPASATQIFCGGGWGFAELELHAPVVTEKGSYCSHLKTTVFVLDISPATGIDIVSTILESFCCGKPEN